MNKIISNITLLALTVFTGVAFVSCEKNSLPQTETIAANAYYGEWNGVTASTRSLTNGKITETPASLNEVMSLRQENGKDTFNFKDPVTGINIAGRLGTWYITQVNNSEDQAVNGARILRLRVITSATRITYTTLTIKQLDGKTLVLNDGANKTLTYAIK